jgi:hypothetical protein
MHASAAEKRKRKKLTLRLHFRDGVLNGGGDPGGCRSGGRFGSDGGGSFGGGGAAAHFSFCGESLRFFSCECCVGGRVAA